VTAAVHARALELAAIAIDFDLSTEESDELRQHLDTCEPCRADATALRGDAARIAALPAIDAPARVRAALVGNRLPGRLRTARPLAVLLTVLVLTVGPLSATVLLRGGFGIGIPGGGPFTPAETPQVAPATGAPAAPTPQPPQSTGAPTQRPSPTPSPEPSASVAPTAEPAPSG